MSLWLSSLDNMPVEPPASVLSWLETPTSITEKAKTSCHHVRLQLLGQQWHKVSGRSVFIREIVIYCDEEPAWYAQTLIPSKTYQLRADQFKNLQENPIGNILFSDPHITREDCFYAYLTPATKEYQEAMKHNFSDTPPPGLWARKSIFLIDGEPLYIMEIFYPDFFSKK